MVPQAAALAAPFCQAGQSPAFADGFVTLAAALERFDDNCHSGRVLQPEVCYERRDGSVGALEELSAELARGLDRHMRCGRPAALGQVGWS
jgi:hypothetical protein